MNFLWVCWCPCPKHLPSNTSSSGKWLFSSTEPRVQFFCYWQNQLDHIPSSQLAPTAPPPPHPLSGDSVLGSWGPSSKLQDCNSPILSFCFLNPNGGCFLPLLPLWLGRSWQTIACDWTLPATCFCKWSFIRTYLGLILLYEAPALLLQPQSLS